MKSKQIRQTEKVETFIKKDDVLIKKLEAIFKQGYLPCREYQTYYFSYATKTPKKKNQMASDIINCFGHAFFNLTNEKLQENSISETDTKPIWHFGEKYGVYLIDEILDFVRATGLTVNECEAHDKMKDNEWKVAFYTDINCNGKDYHFLRQERDGSWTAKNGETAKVEILHGDPPRRLGNRYILYGFYRVGNPNALKTKQPKNAGRQK